MGDTASVKAAERYRCGPLLRWHLGAVHELVRFQLARANKCLDAPVAAALDSWTSFLTPAVAEDRFAKAVTDLDPAAAHKIIRELIESGCLVSRSSLNPLPKLESARAPRSIDCIAIPTANRVGALDRALRSYGAHVLQCGRKVEVFVADNSSGAAASGSAESVASFRRECQIPAWYAGPDEKRRWVGELKKRGEVPPAVIDFALFGAEHATTKVGANRNAILLHSQGGTVLSVDDDTICDSRVVPGTGSSLAIAPHADPNEAWCFLDAHSARSFGVARHVDTMGEHGKYLGVPVRELLPLDDSPGEAPDQLCVHLLGGLLMGEPRIRVTWNGARGDSGFHSNLGQVASASRATRSRIQSLGKEYPAYLASRKVVRQVLLPSISHVELASVGMFMGLDNTALLPPFPPEYRNEDGVFGNALARMSDEYYAAYLPFTLAHEPSEDRFYPPQADSHLRMSDLLTYCLSIWQPPFGRADACDRLVSMGRHLGSLGRLPAGDFDELSNVLMCSRICSTISLLESVLASDGSESRHWADDVSGRIVSLRRATAIPEFFVPRDLVPAVGGSRSADASRRRAQRFLAQYGELLEWWPAIVQCATQLREHGITIGRRL